MNIILTVEFKSGMSYELEIYKNIYKVKTERDIEFFATKKGIKKILITEYETHLYTRNIVPSIEYKFVISFIEDEEEKCILVQESGNNIHVFKKLLKKFLSIYKNISIDLDKNNLNDC